MPLLWQALLKQFLKTTGASVVAFIAILLTMQLDEIAHFAALGAPLSYVFLFSFYQIPYILPIALPLSCLIASFICLQRLSLSHELTALRSCGLALRHILAPIWLASAFLTIANFWITSEVATHSHLQNNLLKNELRAINPLLLLHNKHLMRLKGFYFDAFGVSHVADFSSDAILAFPNKRNQRLSLMLAERIESSSESFIGKGVTLITGMPSEKEDDFDPLFIENIEYTRTKVKDFSDMLQKKVWTINNDYLQLPLLLARIKEQRALLPKLKKEAEGPLNAKGLKYQLNRSVSELIKRFSLALTPFTFTLMGGAFGIRIGRRKNIAPLFAVIGLATLYLVSFFMAKGADHHKWLAASLYLIPHLVIATAALWTLKRIAQGVEG